MLNPYTFLLKTEIETSSKADNLLGSQGKANLAMNSVPNIQSFVVPKRARGLPSFQFVQHESMYTRG